MTEDGAIEIEQRHAHIARRAHGLNVGIVAVDLDQIVGNMNQAALVDHSLAGSSVHHHLPTFEPLFTHPEGQRLQPARLGKVFRDPGAVGIERRRELFYQSLEKLLAGLCSGALQDSSERSVDINILKGWTIHSSAILRASVRHLATDDQRSGLVFTGLQLRREQCGRQALKTEY